MAKAGHLTTGQGFRIKLVNQNLEFYEKTVQPKGLDGGDPINITTNDNTEKESQAPRKLSTDTDAQITHTYNAADKALYEAAVNQSDDILQIFSDDSTEAARPGWLRSFTPESAEKGSQPMATSIFSFYGEAAT